MSLPSELWLLISSHLVSTDLDAYQTLRQLSSSTASALSSPRTIVTKLSPEKIRALCIQHIANNKPNVVKWLHSFSHLDICALDYGNIKCNDTMYKALHPSLNQELIALRLLGLTKGWIWSRPTPILSQRQALSLRVAWLHQYSTHGLPKFSKEELLDPDFTESLYNAGCTPCKHYNLPEIVTKQFLVEVHRRAISDTIQTNYQV